MSKKTIAELYEEFDRRNPTVKDELTELAEKAHASGRTKVGMKHLIEVLRWDRSLQTDTRGQPIPAFKINNNFAPLYARTIAAERTHLRTLFDTRRLEVERNTRRLLGVVR